MTVDEAMHKIDKLERLLDHCRGEPSYDLQTSVSDMHKEYLNLI